MNLKEYIEQHKATFDNEKMSYNADEVFKERLQKELHSSRKGKIVYWKFTSIAASILLVISVFFLVKTVENSDKKEVLASLAADSAGERLSGVYKFSEEFAKEDKQIIDRLIKILHKDSNTNVKIATIDALLKFPANEKIRLNLIEALEKEKTPLVQIKIIKSLSFLRENRAQKPLEKLIDSQQTYAIVKSNATLAINQLKQ